MACVYNRYGNARYWVLKLLIDHFAPGDSFVSTQVATSNQCGTGGGVNPFCGESDGEAGYPPFTLQCCDPDAVMTSIEFAVRLL